MPRKRKKRKPLIPAWVASFIILWNDLRKTIFLGSANLLLRGLTRFWRLWAVGIVALLAGVYADSAAVGYVLYVTMLAGLLFLRWKRPKPGSRWWDHDTLSAALVDAGVLRMAGDALPSLSYRGKPQHSEHGTTVTVGLPQAKGLDDVKGSRLAAALRVPAARLAVTQDEDDPANVVRIHVGEVSKVTSVAPVAASARSEWATPVRIGFDPQGHAVELATEEANTLVAGRPGSGKTSLSRITLAHYLLDPSTAIYLLDGKGSVDDYGSARPMCQQFVSGTDDDAVPDTLAMLGGVLDLVRARNAKGGDHPGVLLLLEEFQDVRAAAGRDARDRLDSTLGRIVRMGRAVSVHVLVSTQRPTTDDLPAGTRNLLSQRVALMLRNAADAGLVLGTAPSLALPKRRGQALFTDGGPVVGVELDRLTDDAWRKVCRRAAVLRAPFRPTLTLAPPLPSGSPVEEGLVSEVVALLRDEGPLSTTDLHTRLSATARDSVGSEVRLGIALKPFAPRVLRKTRAGNGSVWCLAEDRDWSARGVDA